MPLHPGFPGLTFDPVLYPVTQVFAGKNLLVDLTCLYGLFPFFITPLFKLIGLNVLNFSVFLATLVCVSLFFVMKFMKYVIKNNTIFLLGFLFVVYYTLLATRSSPEFYYQYWPIRYFFPTLSLLLSALYLKSENKFIYYASFVINGIAVLWNFDVGIIVFLTWIIILAYNDASISSTWKSFIVKIFKHCVYACIGLGFVIAFFCAVTYIQSGKLPNLPSFFQFQEMFLAGYFMIKLVPFPHIWSLLLFIYGIGLFIGINAFIKKQIGFNEKIITLLTSMGLGLFVYYEGQSSNVTLFRVWYPALLLLVLFADMLWKKYELTKQFTYLEYCVFSILFLMFISAPISMFYNLHKYSTFIHYNVLTSYHENNPLLTNIDFLKKQTHFGENVFILGNFKQAVYYAETNTRSAVNVPSLPDIFYPYEMRRVLDFLETNKNIKLFVEQPLTAYDLYDQNIRKIITSRYMEESRSISGMSLYTLKIDN